MFRSSHRKCSIKKLPFAMFTGKCMCWSLYLKKLLAFRPATLLKGDSRTSAFLWILRNFLRASILKNICKRLLLIVLLKDCENPTGTASFLIPDFSIFSLTKGQLLDLNLLISSWILLLKFEADLIRHKNTIRKYPTNNINHPLEIFESQATVIFHTCTKSTIVYFDWFIALRERCRKFFLVRILPYLDWKEQKLSFADVLQNSCS